MKRYFFLLLFFSPAFIYAQSGVAWFNQSWTDGVTCNDLAVDAAKNQYYTGYYTNMLVFEQDTLVSKGEEDVFIAKFDASGNYIWSISIGADFEDLGYTLSLDGTGNVLIAGTYSDTVDFDPGIDTVNLTTDFPLPYEPNHGFLLKLTPLGDFIWVKKFGDTGGMEFNQSQVSNDGAIFLGGHFYARIDMDPDNMVTEIVESHNSLDGFIVKLDSLGQLIWYTTFGGDQNGVLTDFVVDNLGSVFFTGFFGGAVNFYPDSFPIPLLGDGSRDILFGKINSNNSIAFVRKITGPGSYDQPNRIQLDSQKRMIIVGGFNGTMDFDPGPGVSNLTEISALGTHFIAQYDSVGVYQWAQRFNTGGFLYSNTNRMTLNVAENNNVLWTAYYDGSPSYTTLAEGVVSLYSTTRGTYIAKINPLGQTIWIKDYQGKALVKEVALEDDFSMFVTGEFAGYCDFDIEATGYVQNSSFPAYSFFNYRTNYPTLDIQSELNNDLWIYPNPTYDHLYLKTNEFEKTEYIIYNISGLTMKSGNYSGVISTSDLVAGIYFIKIKNESGTSTLSFVKQ